VDRSFLTEEGQPFKKKGVSPTMYTFTRKRGEGGGRLPAEFFSPVFREGKVRTRKENCPSSVLAEAS